MFQGANRFFEPADPAHWAMPEPFVAPWIPPTEPSLARLAMEAADAEGVAALRDWPEARGNGVAFASLPAFLCWAGELDGQHHLLLLQARELGALGPGARPAGLPERWLLDLDLESLARPLGRHPAFPGGAAVHVLQVPATGLAWVRSRGGDSGAAAVAAAALARLTGTAPWEVRAAPAGL